MAKAQLAAKVPDLHVDSRRTSDAISKVIFLIDYPFSERDYNRFGVAILQGNGFNVEIWDLTPFLRPQVYRDVKVPDPINYQGCRQFITQHETLVAISQLDRSCFIICLIPFDYASLPIFRAITKLRIRYGLVATNAMPEAHMNGSPTRFLVRLMRATPNTLLHSLARRIREHSLGLLRKAIIRPATIVLAGGKLSVQPNRLIGRDTIILWMHTLDYDIYLQERDRPMSIDTRMGVFLDQYASFHPDYIYMGIPWSAAPEDYYPRLCKFFDSLECQYGVHIVIAAHPRSHYEEHPDYFGGRPVKRGRTAELVKKSGFVMAHQSGALNFAVLFRKPVLFVTTDRLQHSLEGPYISAMSSWLGKTPINLDQSLALDWQKETTVNEAAYARYQEAYIKTTGSPDKPCWQIFADYLKAFEP